jgi:hypothetical protein
MTYLHTKNTNNAGRNPACSSVKQKIIFVLPGPGRAWHIANNS